ncbi:MAG: hypothetical protein IKE46_05190 [Selenomonadaceae bacterium]|nr:hypothetical protein [Selenomonadaceae bacterium]
MTDENITKLTTRATELHFAENLPAEICGFTTEKIFAADGDKFIFFTCTNDELHCALKTYFHEETAEFKVSQRIGLTEFCLTKFFTEDFAAFQKLIDAELEHALKNLRDVRNGNFNRFLREKEIDTWTYGKNLPATLEDFELFISPEKPVEVTNGSFIIINYVDFAAGSDFVLYYNIYGDVFSAESRIKGDTQVSYAFESTTLPELEESLKENLSAELKNIRRLSQ